MHSFKRYLLLFGTLLILGPALAQSSVPDYYQLLRIDTVKVCQGSKLSCTQMSQCQMRFMELMCERWWNGLNEPETAIGYSRSIWFYGDYWKLGFDSIEVKITRFEGDYHTDRYIFTPKQAEQFFMRAQPRAKKR